MEDDEVLMTFLATRQDRERWKEATKGSKKPSISDICRAALNRYAARQKKLKEKSND